MKTCLITFILLLLVTACSTDDTQSTANTDPANNSDSIESSNNTEANNTGNTETNNTGEDATSESIDIDMALFHTENDAFAEVFKRWQEEVENETEGRVTFTPYYSASLVELFDTLGAVRDGSVDAGILSAGAISGEIPSMGLLEVFGVVPDEEMYPNMYEEVTPLLEDIFEEENIKMLFWAPGGIDMLAFHSDETLTEPGDFEGLSMRTAGRWQAEQVSMLNASPVTMDPSELYLALQQGTIDSTFQTVSLAHGASLHEVAPYIASLRIPLNTVQWVINPDVWDQIPEEDQQIIEQVSEEAGLHSYGVIEEAEAAHKEDIAQDGGEIYELTDEELEPFYDLFIPVAETIVEESGETGEQLNEILEQYR